MTQGELRDYLESRLLAYAQFVGQVHALTQMPDAALALRAITVADVQLHERLETLAADADAQVGVR